MAYFRRFGPAARRALAAVACLFVCAVPAEGARIALRAFTDLATVSNTVVLTGAITNLGDEPARDVRLVCRLDDREATTAVAARLDPRASVPVNLSLGPVPTLPGDAPVRILFRYNDPRGYPASSCTVDQWIGTDARAAAAPFTLRLADAELRPTGGRLTATLAPTHGATGTPVRLRLTLPDEIAGPTEALPARVAAGSDTVVGFDLHTRHALPGSIYRAYLTAEWNEHGLRRCATACAFVTLPARINVLLRNRQACTFAALLLLAFFAIVQVVPARRLPRPAWVRGRVPERVELALVLGATAWFVLDHLPVALLFRDTATAGGDTVAHSYLAAHLRDTLFAHGRIISWAGGWWCGFPAFQYYFPLPYVAMALLSLALPLNVAFKLISVAGILALPAAAWASARRLGLPRPGPALVSIAAVPFLFDRAHTMWGVNIYSTLAGMIANSIGFPLMLLAVGCAWNDADGGRFRLRTAALLALLLASHFFTSVVAAGMLAVLPLLRPKAGFRRACGVLAAEGALAGLLMAWWLVPLLARGALALDFGTNWPVHLCTSLPRYLLALAPFAAAGSVAALRFGGVRFFLTIGWMTAVAAVLFRCGYALAPVFVNVRLWPFVAYGLGALGAAGAGILLSRARWRLLAVAAALLLVLSWCVPAHNDIRAWAEWNYAGLQAKPRWAVLRDLVLPLDGTPGRLANDLHGDNNAIGSSRVFEAVPFLIDKPILEGGLVNSALGSLLAYYIQGETSDAAAGFPTQLKPGVFNIVNATRHLELANVSHFVARSDRTRKALEACPQWWRRVAASGDWTLFALTTHSNRTVTVADAPLPAVQTDDWIDASLAWLYRIEALAQPFILADKTTPAPPDAVVYTDRAYRAELRRCMQPADAPAPAWVTNSAPVEWESVTDGSIRFRTRAVGRPHIIKCTWYPNWRVRGAAAVYRITPAFMAVIPTQSDVDLYYGSTAADNAGRLLTLAGCLAAAAWATVGSRHRRRRKAGEDGGGTHLDSETA